MLSHMYIENEEFYYARNNMNEAITARDTFELADGWLDTITMNVAFRILSAIDDSTSNTEHVSRSWMGAD